jgi:HAD superfamily hydrolase (TIGR01549 family)/HAD superfamily hydrolase (TIGR01509 family)
MNLQAVFFDMGGTIETFRYDRALRIKNANLIRACLDKAGVHLDLTDELLADVITQGITAYHRWNMASRIEIAPVLVWKNYVFKDWPVSEQQLQPIAEELACLYETRFYEREMKPEVPAVLARIKQMGLKIGCISNVQSRGQVPTNLKKYGIFEYFSPIVLSSEYGRRKPDPAIFYHAAHLAQVPTSACVYVGDKLDRDISGAQGAGFRLAVQIRHVFEDGDYREDAVPDAIIHDMCELLPLLEREIENDRRAALNVVSREIDAILFDAGDILYHRPQKKQNLVQFLAQQPSHRIPLDFDEKRAALIDQAYCGEISRHEYYVEVLKMYGIQGEAAIAAGMEAMEQDDRAVEIFPGVPETLRKLKQQGFLLGIITDTALALHIKLDWFAKAGFGNVWDAVISSKEMKIRKPDPKIYQAALNQLGIAPQRAVFVGHKQTELDGAKAVGMKTIAYNYEPGALADFYLNHFSDLNMLPWTVPKTGNHGFNPLMD